jgi:hypothetical protein
VQAVLLGLAIGRPGYGQNSVELNSNCVVSVLNRNMQVADDGSWVLPDVPAGFGPVRARATCVQGGATLLGQSDLFTLAANQVINLPHVQLGNATGIPTGLTLTAPQTTLSNVGQTVQLSVTATYTSGNPQDVTGGSTGTVYRVSNSKLATVSADGLVTAVAPGTVLVQATNEGTQGLLLLQVGFSSSGGTLPQTPADLVAALSSIEVKPSTFVLTTSPVSPQASQQLQVLGLLNDGQTTIDLTSNQVWGTNYSSSDLTICNFGTPDGNVFAGNSGPCTITVRIAGFQATAAGRVIAFSPQPVSALNMPGYADGVDLNGSYAYVAAGPAGLQVVDVSNRSNPQIVGSISLPGNADDVQVAGNLAYVSAGTAGVQIVDVTNPLAPSVVSSISTGDEVRKTVVSGGIAYVANGASGIKTYNVASPAAPVGLGTLSLSGFTKGLDVDTSRGLLVAVGSGGLFTINVANPLSPVLMGSLNWGGDSRDVALQGNFAFVADINTSLTSIDISNPASPVMGTSTDLTLGGRLRDLTIRGNLEFGADVYFGKGVPIVDISTAPAMTPVAILYFSQNNEVNYVAGTGVVTDATYVYLTAGNDIFTEKPTAGSSQLYIGLYAPPQDTLGIPPTAAITSPANGSTAQWTCPITVNATDDVAVAYVDVIINGQVMATLSSAPYQYTYVIPAGVTSLTIGAQAGDFGGNVGTAQPVTVTAIPNTIPPTVTITSPADGSQVLQGQQISISVSASGNLPVSYVNILINGQVVATLPSSSSYYYAYTVPIGMTSVIVGAQAVDAVGNVGTAQPVTVTANPPLPATVTIVAPVDGSTVVQGRCLDIEVTATDNVTITEVDILVDGQVVFTATPSQPVADVTPGRTPSHARTRERCCEALLTSSASYSYVYQVPPNATTLVIGARALNSSGMTGTAQSVTITAAPEPLTMAQGTVTDSAGNPVGSANVVCEGKAATSAADGTFSVPSLHTVDGPLVCSAWATVGAVLVSGSSAAVAPVAGGATNVGAIALTALSSLGRDFWVAYPGLNCLGSEETISASVAIVSGGATANYTVTNAAASFSATGVVTPGSPAWVQLPDVAVCAQQTVEDAGTHITSDADVSVSLSYSQAPSESYLAIPTPALGTEYYGLSYEAPNGGNEDMLAVVATQNSTHVTITASCGTSTTATLDQGQTYNIQTNDVSGVHVVSDNPIAVVAGNPNGTYIPPTSNDSGALLEMMFPVGPLWGTEFYSAPLSLEQGTVYRVMAAVDGTTVTVDAGGGNVQTLQLDHGQFQELDFQNSTFSGVHFTSTSPTLLMQYGAGIASSGGQWGDPFAMQLVPVTSFAQSFAFYGPQNFSNYQSADWALIIAPVAAVGSVQLNGSAVAASSFAPLPGGQFVYAEVPVSTGQNVVTSTQPITVYSVGYLSYIPTGPTDPVSTYGAPTRF